MISRATAPAATRAGRHLRVNPITCDAHGMCAELLPEHIALDEWGYPLIADSEVPAELLSLARRAANACPTRALLIRSDRRGK